MTTDAPQDEHEHPNQNPLPRMPRDASDQDQRNADKRDGRSRAAFLKHMFDELDVEQYLAEQITKDLAGLLPPKHRMSRAEDVSERLKSLIQRDAKAPSEMRMSNTGVQLNVADENTVRSTELLAELTSTGDERILQAYVANERLRSVLATQVAEHDAARNALVAELARRYTLTEQWRYKLPKSLMPVIAVLLAAKISRDQMRPGSPLVNEIIDVVLQHCRDEKITVNSLAQAASNAEDQFASPIETEPTDQANPSVSGGESLSIDQAKRRLNDLHSRLASEWRRCEDATRKADLKAAMWPTSRLTQMSAGLDEHDRPIFESIEDFN
ncbi:MAG: hypothetical protein C0517_06625, partial [Erythrobacter sp.]|nr:hypothetical protein [Erythrobacter sp.]